MSKCKNHRELLDFWLLGLGDLDAFDHDHASGCPRCSDALAEAQTLREAFREYVHQETVSASEALESRAGIQPASLRTTFTRGWSRLWVGSAAAAVFILIATGLWRRGGEHGDRPSLPQPSETASHYLTRVDEDSRRQEMVAYLDRSRGLFLSLLYGATDCAEGDVLIGAEQQVAQGLLRQKRLLEPELSRPGRADLRPLFDEVELLLLDVAGGDECISRSDFEGWQQTLHERRTLEKLHLLQMEGRI